jgi:hypothetical protein
VKTGPVIRAGFSCFGHTKLDRIAATALMTPMPVVEHLEAWDGRVAADL